jgi:hypothetical protein
MQFTIINPKQKSITAVECKDLKTAEGIAGLDKVDHGVVKRGVGIVVYEFGLFEPPATQYYFAIDRRLYAGNAVLYGFDEAGETIDMTDTTCKPVWFDRVAQILFAIRMKAIDRPMLSVNGDVLWKWPDPPPEGMMR